MNILRITLLIFLIPIYSFSQVGFTTEGSFVFDGIDDMIIVPNTEELNPKSMSISFDFQLLDTFSLKSGKNLTSQFMIFKRNPNKYYNEGIAVLYDENSENIIATVANSDRKQIFAYSPKQSIEKNKWYSVVVSADSNYLKLYLDGKLQKYNSTEFPLYFDKEPFLIGGRNNVILEKEDYGGMFNGEMRNIRVYNHSIDEIGESEYFSKDISIDSLILFEYSNNETNGIVFDKFDRHNGVFVKGRPTILEKKEADYVRVSPNPTKGKTNISFKLYYKTDVKILVRDITGKEVIKVLDDVLTTGEHTVHFYPTNLVNGYYVCFVETPGLVRQATFIVNK